MKDLYIAVILAFISGITLLAYKHKSGYSKIYPWLMFATFIFFIGILSYNAGIDKGHLSLYRLIGLEKSIEADVIIKQIKISDIYLLISNVSFLYLSFLKYILPTLTKDTQKNNNQNSTTDSE